MILTQGYGYILSFPATRESGICRTPPGDCGLLEEIQCSTKVEGNSRGKTKLTRECEESDTSRKKTNLHGKILCLV